MTSEHKFYIKVEVLFINKFCIQNFTQQQTTTEIKEKSKHFGYKYYQSLKSQSEFSLKWLFTVGSPFGYTSVQFLSLLAHQI